jgi:hypothetical protein
MGTNYYVNVNICPHCNVAEKEYHIGKSSYGWCFSLHVIPEEGINSLEDWDKFISENRCKITDEYGKQISWKELKETVICNRENFSALHNDDENFYEENHCEPGPYGLVRHKIDGVHCVGQGSGTFDFIVGEFL